ncbi:MAG: hypothetical protein ACLUUO_15215 [Sellimonas intestinalis]
MKAVVNNPARSGYAAHRTDMELAGKTGTAELKSEQGTTGQEIDVQRLYDRSFRLKTCLTSMVESVRIKAAAPTL